MYTKNFSIEEMACKCKGLCDKSQRMQIGFMLQLQKLRDLMAEPLTVTSGFRCEAYNKEVGGVRDSYHVRGLAVDLSCSGDRFRAHIIEYAHKAGFYGIGISPNFIHLDTRGYGQRSIWLYS